MLNTTILIKLTDDIETGIDEEKLLINKIMTAMRCYDYDFKKLKDGIFFAIINNEIFVELYNNSTRRWLVNIYGHDDKKKCMLIDTIKSDNTFDEIIIVFDAISNWVLKENYPVINEFENNLRSEFCYKVIDNWKVDIFDIVDKLNVKDEFRFNECTIPKNMNTKLQRFELVELIEYINDHRLGGDEFNKFYESFTKCKEHGNDEYEDFKILLKTNIFKDISNKINNVDKIRRVRNIVSHNSIINSNKFNSYMIDINKFHTQIKELYLKDIKETFNIDSNDKKHVTILIENSILDVSDIKIKLKFSQILNNCGYIYENKSENIEIINRNDDVYEYILSQETEDGIGFILRYKLNSKDNGNGIYLLNICFNGDLEESKIAILRDNLINNLVGSRIMIINDYISTKYCSELYYKMNFIENIVRSYISIFYFFRGLDINKIAIKKNSKSDELTLNNNLYDCNFIDLMKIIDNPPESKKVADLVNELSKLLNNGDNNHKEIENKLKNISDANADVVDIIKVWNDLYKYRTIIAHSEYISQLEYLRINEIIDSAMEKVEKVFFDEIENNFEIRNKYNEEIKISKLDNRFSININLNSKSILLKIEEHAYEFQDIGIFRFYRLLSVILGDSSNELSYILTIDSINYYIDRSLGKLEDLLGEHNYDHIVNKIIVELGYTKYTNYRVISSKEDILEEKIGNLLKSIEGKINESEDESCATVQLDLSEN